MIKPGEVFLLTEHEADLVERARADERAACALYLERWFAEHFGGRGALLFGALIVAIRLGRWRS